VTVRDVNRPAKEVARRVFSLREALTQPVGDPREAASAMHEVLVAPILPDLRAAGATSILWSLDGPLRYIPTAALWDAASKRWLVQDYRTAVIATADVSKLGRSAKADLKVLGAGVTLAYHGLQPLKSVAAELEAVVRDRANPSGALPGQRLLDKDFTREAWLRELGKRWSVVHVASHYVFSPGAEGSYLLLGDGDRLTLEDLDASASENFRGVELLTLSACETALAAEDGMVELAGSEVDGLAMVAQKGGAANVLASLWAVDDPATARVMANLYRKIGSGKASVGEALRTAQLELLGPTGGAPADPKTRGIKGRNSDGTTRGPPSLAHPYYWAAFVLLGGG
jgi:CHAT domain-containing protein